MASKFDTLDDKFEDYSNDIVTMGEETKPQKGSMSEELSRFRRVDIMINPPVSEPIPEPDKSEPEKLPLANRWKARLRASVSAGIIDKLLIQIVDRENDLWMEYEYTGATHPILAFGLGGGGQTDWTAFTTNQEVYIKMWKGVGSVVGFQAQIPGKGISETTVTIGANTSNGPIQVTFKGWGGEGLGLGGGITWGLWSPVDPGSGEWPKDL